MGVLFVKLSSLLGLSLTSGINLYATVAVVGIVTKFELIAGLPPEFQAFNNDFIIILAIVLYACEFAADKIPAFDTVWDSVHTAVRPFGAALIALTVVGDADPAVQVAAGLLGGALGLATHTAKAGTRLVVNTSPEPVSNVALSLGEDAAVVGMSLLVLSHPFLSLVVSLVVVGLLVSFGPGLWRAALLTLRAVPARVAASFRAEAAVPSETFLPDAVDAAVDREILSEEKILVSQRCYARKVKGCGRNRKGYLVLTDRRLLFVFRGWLGTRSRQWPTRDLEKAGLSRRFLVDVVRVRSGGRYLNFIFLKSRAPAASRIADRLSALIGHRDDAAPSGERGNVLAMSAPTGS